MSSGVEPEFIDRLNDMLGPDVVLGGSLIFVGLVFLGPMAFSRVRKSFPGATERVFNAAFDTIGISFRIFWGLLLFALAILCALLSLFVVLGILGLLLFGIRQLF